MFLRMGQGKEKRGQSGFSLVEVIIASIIMVVLCVAALSAFSYASSVNRGNNLRSQSLSTLQEEIEYYRGLQFKRSGSDAALNAGTYFKGAKTSGDGTQFQVVVLIKNLPNPPSTTVPSDALVTMKEITVTAERVGDEGKWFGGATSITMLRVRAN
jgi:prepilin-type N-terminal cleavage/methylation domain-containing protein